MIQRGSSTRSEIKIHAREARVCLRPGERKIDDTVTTANF